MVWKIYVTFLRQNIVLNPTMASIKAGKAYIHQSTANKIVHVDRQMHKDFIVYS
jgi:hypothetical protein